MRSTLLLAAAALALPAAAQAQSNQSAPQTLSKATYLANTQAEFAAIDTNKDNAVSTAEIEAARTKALASIIQRRAAAMFAQLDSDKNGALSEAEFAKGMKPSGDLPPSPIAAFDSNKDGRVSAAEYRTGMEARFNRTDANKDGVITQAELNPTPSR